MEIVNAIVSIVIKPTAVARMAHEVNRAYCKSLGDNTQPGWDDAEPWQKNSAVSGVLLHLSNEGLGAEASHDAWMSAKLDNGWTYGPEKDPELKMHPCIVPFADLPVDQQAKDYIFQAVVEQMKQFAKELGAEIRFL